MKKYIAKSDTWFKAETEVKLIDDYRSDGWNAGLFKGLRICEHPEAEGGIPKGAEILDDEEICNFDEFEIIEVKD